MIRSCAEPGEVWYCRQCSLERGLFHRCPGCVRTIEAPASSVLCDDLCKQCHTALQQEKMLLTGAWHWCPECSHIVEAADREALCDSCTQHHAWKHQRAEENRRIQARIEHERLEHRRAYAKAYRQRRKEREQENRRRAALGLPPLEVPQARPEEEILVHRGHQFQREREGQRANCIPLSAVRNAVEQPATLHLCRHQGVSHLVPYSASPQDAHTTPQAASHTRTQPEAVMEGSFARYSLYSQQESVPIERKPRAKKKGRG